VLADTSEACQPSLIVAPGNLTEVGIILLTETIECVHRRPNNTLWRLSQIAQE
jgi:hypothetical protein